MADNFMFNTMYQDALIGLENGQLMPWDKDILASAPLPSSVSDSFTTKEMPDVLESMKLTFNAMSIWIEEAKKANYFSKRFVQLSKMVMNGVTTMGRGLVTLHARGEDLSQSPMSIQDLLGVASYHFRKSYLGVLQTSRSHPEIGERLLMNQIGWNNMLMRLFKTRDKLAEPLVRKEQGARIEGQNRGQNSGAGEQNLGTVGREVQALPEASELLVQALNDRSQSLGLKSAAAGLSAPSAIREPGALTTPRAFSIFDNRIQDSWARDQKNEEGRRQNEVNAGKQEAKITKEEIKEEQQNKEDGADTKEEKQNQGNRTKITEDRQNQENEEKILEKQQNVKEEEKILEVQQNGGSETEITEKFQDKENDRNPEDEDTFKENQNDTESYLPSEPPVGQSLENDSGDSPIKGQSPVGQPIENDSEDNPMKGQSPEEQDPPDSRSSPDEENGQPPHSNRPRICRDTCKSCKTSLPAADRLKTANSPSRSTNSATLPPIRTSTVSNRTRLPKCARSCSRWTADED